MRALELESVRCSLTLVAGTVQVTVLQMVVKRSCWSASAAMSARSAAVV